MRRGRTNKLHEPMAHGAYEVLTPRWPHGPLRLSRTHFSSGTMLAALVESQHIDDSLEIPAKKVSRKCAGLFFRLW